MTRPMEVSELEERFSQLWASLLPVGLSPERSGYRRFAWSPVDVQLRSWFRDQAAARGLSYDVDRNGNQWAWRGTPADGAVVTGSHLDSVPNGGAYDGPLGIVSAFLALDELNGARLLRPVAIVNFADEEGARFGVACVGSRLLTGVLSPAAAHALRDERGVTLDEAMAAAGVAAGSIGRDEVALARIGAFVELHIEQGRSLVDDDAAIGVATGIWPHGRWAFTFTGEANHAGTTRLTDRRDPMLPFAATVLAARRLADEAGALATFGKVLVVPNGTNAIPSAVHSWLDLRAAAPQTVAAVLNALHATAEDAATPHGVSVTVTNESMTPGVEFDDVLGVRIAKVLGGVPALPTGAGHDAGILAAVVPAAMLFVRNRSGVSHGPAEHADVADCVAGVRALASVLEDLACR